MIDEDRTLQLFGYISTELSKGSKKKIIRICDACGIVSEITYQSYNNAKNRDLCKFCSSIGINCGEKSGTWTGGKTMKFCEFCKREFKSYLSRNQKFCSRECVDKWRSENIVGNKTSNWKGGEIVKVCAFCNRCFKSQRSNNRKFCSTECQNKWRSENMIGENSTNWKGGISHDRSHVLNESQCIKLNSRFKGSEMHHIMSGVVIYIPKDLHNRKYGISHNMKSGKNMKEINILALDYLMGGL